jgi:deazaflavin-dependent oxidoreductase (nitroreductase family)
MDLRAVAKKKLVRLTTRGRKSGKPRTVEVWFVVADSQSVYVQHASRGPAQWYRNLVQDPGVTLDFGDKPLPARAEPIGEPERVREVLRLIRRKYPMAWLIQLLGVGHRAVAAKITLTR